ncbi:MAG: galactokinase [Acidobacteria bacterium]|nr:galactokinase [Acidobacteriota bacterium]
MKARRFRAPGRVNLIGEHTDYNDGFVMPAALAFETVVKIKPRSDRTVTLHSKQFVDPVQFSLDEADAQPRNAWSDYVQGVAIELEQAGYRLQGADLAIDSNVPVGAGLSSSAALEVSSGLALSTVAGHTIERKELARICQRAENEFVGMKCGIMDQFISLHGEPNHAVLLDCRSLEYRAVPLPEHVRIVVCNTMVKHQLNGSEYNARRQDCMDAALLLGVATLRDIGYEQFCVMQDSLPERVRMRASHVIQEIERTERAADVLELGDLEQFGRFLFESHETLRDLYEVSCAELDLMVKLAQEQEGVYGARMTGGGFGGCTVNLVEAEHTERFRTQVAAAYRQATGIQPEIYVCAASGGAGEVLL